MSESSLFFQWFFHSSPIDRVLTLYTNSLWITLAPVVWPLLLAQSLDGTTSHCNFFFSMVQIFTAWSLHRFLMSLVHTFVHWPRFSTAAFQRSLVLLSLLMRRYDLSIPRFINGLLSFYLSNYLISFLRILNQVNFHSLFFYSKIQYANILYFKSRTFYKVLFSRTPRFLRQV